jgi:hypothetical protein
MFADDDSDELPPPGEDRSSMGAVPPLLQDLLVTGAHRILDELDRQGLLMEYLTQWDTQKQARYSFLVTKTYSELGAPPIDEDVIDD